MWTYHIWSHVALVQLSQLIVFYVPFRFMEHQIHPTLTGDPSSNNLHQTGANLLQNHVNSSASKTGSFKRSSYTHTLIHSTSTSTPKSPAGSVFFPKPVNVASNGEVQPNALPVPVPNSGHTSVQQSYPTTLVILQTFNSASIQPSALVSLVSSPSTADPSTDAAYAPFPTIPPRKQGQKTSDNHILAIILASLGGAALISIILVVFKICTRPKRRFHPTPSLPVLQDVFLDRTTAEDSPVFGGKERFSSSLSGDKEKWTWTQYHSKPAKEWRSEKDSRTIFADPDLPQNGTMLSALPSTRRPSLLARSISRISALSSYSSSKTDVAGLMSTPSQFTIDPFTDHARARTSYVPQPKDRNTIRISVRDWDAGGDQPSHEKHEVLAQPLPATRTTGRQRIKAPYPVGSCPSMNSIAPSISVSPSIVSDPFEDTPFAVAPFIKTEARRERDTKALTAALGLQSPPRPSVTDQARSRRYLEAGSDRAMPGSPAEAGSTRLGNFMMSDDSDYLPTMLPPTMPLKTLGDSISGSKRSRVEDKPPRVPSPPPLPSLAQMAMEHGNSLDYENYRSPTYSLYDIYSSSRSVYGDKVDPSRRV